jgi:hypothetical protein
MRGRRRGSQQRAFAALVPRPGSILETLLNALHVVDLLARSVFAGVRSSIRPLALTTEKSAESRATNRITRSFRAHSRALAQRRWVELGVLEPARLRPFAVGSTRRRMKSASCLKRRGIHVEDG